MRRLSALALLLACNPANDPQRPARPAPVGEAAPFDPHLAVAVADAMRPAGNTFWFALKVPEGCATRVARDPGTDVPVASWVACPGVDGCQTLAPPAGGPPQSGPSRMVHANTREGQQMAVFTGHGIHQLVQIGPLDGPPYVVVDVDGGGGKCSLGQVAFGSYNAIVELIGVGPQGAVDRYFLDAPAGSSIIWYEARMRIAPGSLGDLIPGGYVTTGSAILLYDQRSRLIRGDPASGDFSVMLEDPRWSNIDWITAAGDSLLLGTATIPERSGFIPVDSHTPITLLNVVPGGGTSPVVVADERLYWAEGRSRDKNNRYDVIDLWTGPLPVGPFTLRRIAGTDQRYMMQLHAGGERVAYLTHAVDANQVRELVIVDVADGGSRRVTTTPRGPVLGILGLTRDEILLTVATPGGAPGGAAIATPDIVRLRIDSLGPAAASQ